MVWISVTGFLGLLIWKYVQEAYFREFNIELIATAPSVIYHIHLTDGSMVTIDNPSKLPDPQRIDYIEEPLCQSFHYVTKRVCRGDYGYMSKETWNIW